MEAFISSAISELEAFEASVLAPFFQNKDTMMTIIIGLSATILFYTISSEVKKLFSSITYRLIWVLLIVLATIYSPIVGFLTAVCYVMFLRPSSESFTSSASASGPADCPHEGEAPSMEEPHSFAQEQLEILESKQEDTHLKRFIDGSKKEMDDSINH
jgi:hypothetical protein